MAAVNGQVESISTKFGKWSILVNGTWYGTKVEWKPKMEVNKGDTVSFDDGGGKFVKALKVVGSGVTTVVAGGEGGGASRTAQPEVGRVALSRDRAIIRQNSVTNATNLISNFIKNYKTLEEAIEAVISTAQAFEHYSTGDMEVEEAKRAMAELSAASDGEGEAPF
jgi:hypothetical protein